MIRIIWGALLLVIAAITIGAQLDRQTRLSPNLAQTVPDPFRSFSQAHIVSAAMAAGPSAGAISQAEQLVRLRPMDAGHLRLLAQAQLAQNPTATGEQTLQLAGKLGWRDRATQYGMLRLALAAGDDREAARRLAAIWALSADREEMAALAPAILKQGNARTEFLRLLDADPRWETKAMREAPIILPAELVAIITKRR